jgi:hypothetical protein
MMHCTVGSLLFLWLSFGTLVMVEQVFPEVEESQSTSGIDPELEALKGIELARQSVPPSLSAFPATAASPSLGASPSGEHRCCSSIVPWLCDVARPSLPLHDRFCTYRI